MHSCILSSSLHVSSSFFFNDTAPTEIYTLSLHDALPISRAAPFVAATRSAARGGQVAGGGPGSSGAAGTSGVVAGRSEEHTSELQSRRDLVCRLLLEKKKKTHTLTNQHPTLHTYYCTLSG